MTANPVTNYSGWLAVDPSFRNTGVAHMNATRIMEVGLISTEKRAGMVWADNARCLDDLACALAKRVYHAKQFGATNIYAEAATGSKSAKAGAMMAMSQAVLVTVAALTPMNLVQMLPQEVKLIVCGSRKATKDDIRSAVDQLYPDAFEMMVDKGYKAKKYNEHIYDAIAIGWAINKKLGER